MNRLYLSRGMVPLREGYLEDDGHPESVTVLVAEGTEGRLAGVVIGIDHRIAINDPDNGSSLWALAVDPQAQMPGVGTALVLALAELLPPARPRLHGPVGDAQQRAGDRAL